MRLGSFFIINLALLTVAIVALVRRCRLPPAAGERQLDEGYARGEIDSKQHLRRRCQRGPSMSERRTGQVISRDV